LSSCGCIHDVLRLTPDEAAAFAEYEDDSVEPLRGVMARWEEALSRKGRVPHIVYPTVCVRCGALGPEFFRVPDTEWERYVQPDMRDKVVCRPCYDEIRRLIDSHRSNRQEGG
jgi:ribosomal protein L40E